MEQTIHKAMIRNILNARHVRCKTMNAVAHAKNKRNMEIAHYYTT